MTDDKEKTLEFIEDYRKHQALWDPKHRYYSNNTKRHNAWIAISRKYKLDLRSVKNKIKSLRSYFAKEQRKVITVDNYESTWFAYKSMYFIWDSTGQKEAIEDEENTLEDIYHLDCSNLQDESPNYDAMNNSEMETEFMKQIHDVNSIKDERIDREESRQKRENADNEEEYSVYGQLIAHKLRKLNPRNRLLAQHRINNIFYDLELRELDSITTPMVNSACPVAPTKRSPANSSSGSHEDLCS